MSAMDKMKNDPGRLLMEIKVHEGGVAVHSHAGADARLLGFMIGTAMKALETLSLETSRTMTSSGNKQAAEQFMAEIQWILTTKSTAIFNETEIALRNKTRKDAI